MTPIDIQVSRSKVKVKGHVDFPYIVQRITQELFAPEASNIADSSWWVDGPYPYSGQ